MTENVNGVSGVGLVGLGGRIPLSRALAVNTATTVFLVVLKPVAGILSDRVGRKLLMVVPTICFAVLTWPLLRSCRQR